MVVMGFICSGFYRPPRMRIESDHSLDLTPHLDLWVLDQDLKVCLHLVSCAVARVLWLIRLLCIQKNQ